MNSETWVYDYLVNDVLMSKSFSKDLLIKILGEFSLYCYIAKRDYELPSKYIRLLSEIREDYGCLSHFDVLIDRCLEREIHCDLKNYNEEAMEINFLKSELFGEVVNWKYCLIDLVELINIEGFSTKNAYLLTHIVFYSTRFGREDYWCRFSEVSSIIVDLLSIAEEIFTQKKNWDLVREIYLSRIYVGSPEIENIKRNVEVENKKIYSKEGWYLSDGLRLYDFELRYKVLSEEAKYSLFHTTIISMLLEKKL